MDDKIRGKCSVCKVELRAAVPFVVLSKNSLSDGIQPYAKVCLECCRNIGDGYTRRNSEPLPIITSIPQEELDDSIVRYDINRYLQTHSKFAEFILDGMFYSPKYNLIDRLNTLEKKFDDLTLYVTNKKLACTLKKNLRIRRKDRLYILATNENKCKNCGRQFDQKYLHIDHIIPLAKGGTNDITNLQILCVECNLKKKDYVLPSIDKEGKK